MSLADQARSAASRHLEPTGGLTAAQLDQIVAFESGITRRRPLTSRRAT